MHVGQIAPELELPELWMLSEVLLLQCDLSTLALKQVEMSHLGTFKLAAVRPRKNARVFGRILYFNS